MNIVGASRKLLKNTDKLFFDAFQNIVKNMLWINRTPVPHVTSTTTIFRITSVSMIPYIAKNLHGYNGYNGTD